MNKLINQMAKDAETIPQDNMGKIGAVATDIADTDNEISKIKEKLKEKEDHRRLLSEEVLPSLFSEVGLSELKLADGRNEDEKASSLISDLSEKGLEPAQREWVEPSTLRAFVREQYEVGKELPMDLLGAFIGHKTTIKSE